MSNFIVGLTGGIASGKSEVSHRFEALGITVADADIAAREVVAVGSPVLAEIVERFGPDVVQADGSLDRSRLRQRVFADAADRRALEAITHPAIRARVKSLCESAPGPYAMAAIPLLTEAGGRPSYPWLDRILVIDTPEAAQLSRLLRRDTIDEVLAQRMIDAQATRQQRLALADDVILNDGLPEQLQPQVERLDSLYRRLAGQ